MFIISLILYILYKIFIKNDFNLIVLKDIISAFRNKDYQTFKTVNYFNTSQKKMEWWYNLNPEWRYIFRFQVYSQLDYYGLEVANHILGIYKLKLNLKGVNNLSGLKHLTQLRELSITNYASTDLSDLKHLHQLQKLEFIDCDFSSIVPITPIKQVNDLRFENCQIDTLDSFQYLKNLKRLQLERNCITDLRPIKKASQLEFLSLKNNPIKNFDELAHLPNTKIELSFNQKYDLKKLQDNKITVDIAFNNTYHNYDETFFQNN